MINRIRQFIGSNRAAILLAFAGVVLYSTLSISYAFIQISTIDEGLYQYKGYLFATGAYHPFQPYGPRTQYGPLAYLIPGYVQRLFGPSLLTGRLFGVLTGILAIVGLWLVARRLAGNWWGAAFPNAAAIYNSGISPNANGTATAGGEALATIDFDRTVDPLFAVEMTLLVSF